MQINPQPLYQINQIKDFETKALQNYQLSSDTLMERAGEAAFKWLHSYWPCAERILVITGSGNNGGDGYVLARLAHLNGLKVKVLYLIAPENLKGAAYNAALAAIKAGVSIENFSKEKIINSDVIVDALLGTGLNGKLKPEYTRAIVAINASAIPIFALDVPSGLDANSGKIFGAAIRANLTITFIAHKPGLFTAHGREQCGEIKCADLDLPKEIFEDAIPSGQLLDLKTLTAKYLGKRSRIAHKGDFGHVLVIGGNYGMGGAGRMAAEAAARIGAGLVSVATRPEHVGLVTTTCPELMCHGINNSAELTPLLDRATVVAIGPGLGDDTWSQELWNRLKHLNKPIIIDAGALNLLASKPHFNNNWILTPHPGEAARLLHITSEAAQADRFEAVQSLQKLYGGVAVLKGSGTLIQGPGQAVTSICPYGNPGMASGGMGDVLCGLIAGLVAQGLPLITAAELGVCLHGMAADLVACKYGERGMLAMDLLPKVRKLINFGN